MALRDSRYVRDQRRRDPGDQEKRPGKITFRKDDKKYTIKISEEDNEIYFDGKWYRNFSELCEKAVIDKEKLTSLYYDLYDFKEEK